MKFNRDPEYKPDWSVKYGVELYDHQNDPEENWNQADNPEYKTEVEKLSKLLHAGWRNVPIEDYVYKLPKKKSKAKANQASKVHPLYLKMTITCVILCQMFHVFSLF